MKTLSRQTETFIVRLWAEYLEQTPPLWRGEIEHVGSEEVMRFGTFEEMSQQILRCAIAQEQIREEDT